MKDFYNQFELHYYFYDDLHGFDAITRNECEKELLMLFQEINNDLGLRIRIDATPPTEGGFIELWEFIGENKETLTLFTSILTLLLSRFPVHNKKLTQLQIKNLELDNSIKQEELRKLGIRNIKDVDESSVSKIITYLMKNYKIIWRRSNFFKKITSYKRVRKISVNTLNKLKQSDNKKEIVLGDFEKYILFNENLPDIVNVSAKIDLISSVLKRGKFLWRGFLDKQIVNFEMNDEHFKSLVFQGEVPHTNNITLNVSLSFSRKIDDSGEIKVARYYVTKVNSYFVGDSEYTL